MNFGPFQTFQNTRLWLRLSAFFSRVLSPETQSPHFCEFEQNAANERVRARSLPLQLEHSSRLRPGDPWLGPANRAHARWAFQLGQGTLGRPCFWLLLIVFCGCSCPLPTAAASVRGCRSGFGLYTSCCCCLDTFPRCRDIRRRCRSCDRCVALSKFSPAICCGLVAPGWTPLFLLSPVGG